MLGASMWWSSEFWDWLGKLPSGSASFLGTVTGSALGLFAVILGALYNARLNRQRDDAIREADRIAVASALVAELSNVHRTLVENSETFVERPPAPGEGLVIAGPTVKVFPKLMSNLGLLEPDTINTVMNAYLSTEDYLDRPILLGGKLQTNMPEGRQMVYLSAAQADSVRRLNLFRTGPIKVAMTALAPYLK